MKQSAGILLYRRISSETEFLLAHPGGPFWKSKDLASWSIPKGEFTNEENALDAAIREFQEETGLLLKGVFTELKPVKLKSGKIIYAWACEQDFDTESLVSNTFEMEWPPKSGKFISIPEVDEARWFNYEAAATHINERQKMLLEELIEILA